MENIDKPEMIATILAGIGVPLLLFVLAIKAINPKKLKERSVTVEVGGEPGIAKRNRKYLSLVDTPSEEIKTVADIFEHAVVEFKSKPLLGTRLLLKAESEKGTDGKSFEKLTLGQYVWISYEQAFQRACHFGSGLFALGHKRGERVAIYAETRAEWQISLQACFRHNLCVVTLYATLGEDGIVNLLNETEATTIICERKQLKVIHALSEELGSLNRIVYMEDQLDKSQPILSNAGRNWEVVSFGHVESLGKAAPKKPELPAPEDTAIIMYTSGSTAAPKGVVISHANMVAVTTSVTEAVPGVGPKDVYIAFLPLAHALELVAELVVIMAGAAVGYGSALTMTDSSSKIKKGTRGDITELRPTILAAVPTILDRICDAARKTINARGGLTKQIFDLAYERRLAALNGSWFGARGFEKLFWNALLFGKFRQLLGGRVRIILCGGAPLSGDVQRFVSICFEVPIIQGYGLTETFAVATFSECDDNSVGRVGSPLQHCYIKLVNWKEGGYLVTDKPMPRGEIVIGGYNVAYGYFKNQAKTDECFKVDETGLRWFYSGDIGQFHPDGCLEIVDRKKDIVKLQHGEYISLGKVEAALSLSPYVDKIMVNADPFHSYCVAIIVASHKALDMWAQKVNLQYEDFSDLCRKEEAVREVLKSLFEVGSHAKLHKFEIPAKIKLIAESWTPESGLVTASLKIKREIIRKAYADVLRDLYHI